MFLQFLLGGIFEEYWRLLFFESMLDFCVDSICLRTVLVGRLLVAASISLQVMGLLKLLS